MLNGLPPVDSAFTASSMMIPSSVEENLSAAGAWSDSIFLTCVAAVCILILLFSLRMAVDIMPSLIGCFFRTKENINLENSAKLRHERNIIALCSIPSFCLFATVFRLYDPSFLSGFNDNRRFLIILAVFLVYEIFRMILKRIFLGKSDRLTTSAANCSFTFFILMAAYTGIATGIMTVMNIDQETLKRTLLIGIALIYTMFLIRKTQILADFCTTFSTFLYLCALEILPTGILVASVMLL